MAQTTSASASVRSGPARVDPAYAAAAAPSGPLAQGREFVWTNADFARVQALIYQRAGISLHDGKHAMVYSRLSRRLRDTGHTSFHDYLCWLETHDGPEWQEFVNALTTNLTAFFREQHHFEIFASHLRSRPSANWRVWCNAASTGEEPYSIVITALEALAPRAPFKLAASDIDSNVLAKAARGVYRQDGLKGLSQAQLQRFFLRGKGDNAGMARVRPELRQAIDFLSVNLIRDDWPFREPFDVIFCRNVMIYFDKKTQHELVQKFCNHLEPGGHLFIGHSESLAGSDLPLKQLAPATYMRI